MFLYARGRSAFGWLGVGVDHAEDRVGERMAVLSGLLVLLSKLKVPLKADARAALRVVYSR
jgi:hypothetical protein